MNQKQIDWERNRQFNLLRECRLPAQQVPEGSRMVQVKPAALKGLLTWIDNHAGARGTCWASLDTLAMETGLARNTCIRAMKGLQQLGLIIEVPERRGKVTVYHRRICWANLVDHCPTRAGTEGQAAPASTVQTPQLVPRVEVNSRSGSLPAHEPPRRVPVESMGGCLIPDLPADALSDPGWIQALWEAACDRGIFPEGEAWQVTFFGLCRSLVRWCDKNRAKHLQRGRKAPSPVGILHQVLKRGKNEAAGRVSDEDRTWAARTIRELELVHG